MRLSPGGVLEGGPCEEGTGTGQAPAGVPRRRQLQCRGFSARRAPPFVVVVVLQGRRRWSERFSGAGGRLRFDLLFFLFAACAPRPSSSAGRQQRFGGERAALRDTWSRWRRHRQAAAGTPVLPLPRDCASGIGTCRPGEQRSGRPATIDGRAGQGSCPRSPTPRRCLLLAAAGAGEPLGSPCGGARGSDETCAGALHNRAGG